MNLRKALAIGAGLATAATMLLATPAHADQTGNTAVTFTLANGSLLIAVSGSNASTAAPDNLGTKTPNGVTSQITGNLISTTVTDSRNTTSGYAVSGNCDPFTATVGGSTVTIPKADV